MKWALNGEFGPAAQAGPNLHPTKQAIEYPDEPLYNELDHAIIACKSTCRYHLGNYAIIGGGLFRTRFFAYLAALQAFDMADLEILDLEPRERA